MDFVSDPEKSVDRDQKFVSLVDRYQEPLLRMCCLYLCDKSLAEDAVQEAFSRIYAVRADLDEHRSFSAYLYTIVKRICIDELRRKKRYPTLPGDLPDPPVPSAETEYISRWDRLNRIHLLAELDETDRKLLTAFSLEGKSTKQIAGEMNLTDGQVRVRLHRIRKKMKKGMKDDA